MDPVFAIHFGIVHLPVGGNYQLLDAVRRAFECDRTDAEGYRPILILHQLQKFVSEFPGNQGDGPGARLGQQNNEFIASESSDNVNCTDIAFYHFGSGT